MKTKKTDKFSSFFASVFEEEILNIELSADCNLQRPIANRCRVSGDYLCPECGLPLCDEKCYSAKKNHAAECEMLRAPPTGFKMKVLFNRQV